MKCLLVFYSERTDLILKNICKYTKPYNQYFHNQVLLKKTQIHVLKTRPKYSRYISKNNHLLYLQPTTLHIMYKECSIYVPKSFVRINTNKLRFKCFWNSLVHSMSVPDSNVAFRFTLVCPKLTLFWLYILVLNFGGIFSGCVNLVYAFNIHTICQIFHHEGTVLKITYGTLLLPCVPNHHIEKTTILHQLSCLMQRDHWFFSSLIYHIHKIIIHYYFIKYTP